jgi:hypothetical protein
MMEGFLAPSDGHAIIEGLSIPNDMDSIYALMGACPQHDLLWEGLTGVGNAALARVAPLAPFLCFCPPPPLPSLPLTCTHQLLQGMQAVST